MDFMLYPTFGFSADGRIFVDVPLPRDYLDLVPLFYAQERREETLYYVDVLNEHLKYCGINVHVDPECDLIWDKTKGLEIIKIRPSGGLDLEDRGGLPHFAEHNLGGTRTFVAGAIATKYVKELLKSRP
jgi:hypothetical protein